MKVYLMGIRIISLPNQSGKNLTVEECIYHEINNNVRIASIHVKIHDDCIKLI